MASRPFFGAVPVARFFVVRSPLLPFDELLALSNNLRAPNCLADDAALEAAVTLDRRDVRARLRRLWARPEVREAIFLASPDLVTQWNEREGSEDGGRVEQALARYLLRMCARPTPFGLFAGISVGRVGDTTVLGLAPRTDSRRHVRLDNDYLFALVGRLERNPAIAATLRLTPNSSLYEAAGSIRYAEARFDDTIRTNYLVAVEATDYLVATLERARSGATLEDLAAGLMRDDPEVSRDEAVSFVEQLVESQILVTDLAPAVTGPEPLDGLLERLAPHPAAARVCKRLSEFRTGIEALEAAPLGLERERYLELARGLESLPAELDLSRFVQVDLYKGESEAVIGPEPITEVLKGVELLWRLMPSEPARALTRFVEQFRERYDGREIPLVEALDADLGLEFGTGGRGRGGGTPLLAGLNFGASPDESSSWSRRHEVLHRMVLQALVEGRTETVLTPSDVEALESSERLPLPAAFSALATLVARSSDDVARGEFRVVLSHVGGSSGLSLLGRFCHADATLRRYVAEHIAAEQAHAPDAAFAEIVHLPDGRMANVIARPVLRDFEIPYLGRSAAAPERQIPITDLTVTVEGDRVVLRSRSLRREVIPRLAVAHNVSTSGIPIYRFLAALQHQGVARGLRWDWGPLASSAFLPRVSAGRVVLAPARWRLSRGDVQRLHRVEAGQRYRLAQEWRSAWRLPRFVTLVDEDHWLPIDLDNVLCVDVFIDMASRAGGAVLQEMIPAPEDLLARDLEGRFVHEMVIPFVQPRPAPPPRPRVHSESRGERSFPPGSEWLYVKLYTSESNADRVLREIVAPLRRRALESGMADRWFFIRFADPDHHLRIRFHGDPNRLTAELVPALRDAADPLLKARVLWRVQVDTYEAEIERYGGDEAMPLAEGFFFEDSEAVLELLSSCSGDRGARVRTDFAFSGIDKTLDLFGFDLAAKRSVIASLRASAGRSVTASKSLRVKLGAKFRTARVELDRLLRREGIVDSALDSGLAVLDRRSMRLEPIAAELTALASAEGSPISMTSLVSSFIHMFVNRLLRSQHARQEFVLYDFLGRIYESREARRGSQDA